MLLGGVLTLGQVAGCLSNPSDESEKPGDATQTGRTDETTSPTTGGLLSVNNIETELSPRDHGIANEGMSLWAVDSDRQRSYVPVRSGNPITIGAFDHQTETIAETYTLNSGVGCSTTEVTDDAVYVATKNDGTIHEIDKATGELGQVASIEAEEKIHPWSLESAPDGTLYVGSNVGPTGHVHELSPSGTLRKIGVPAESEKYAYDFAITDDTAFVAVGNTENSGIYEIDRESRDIQRVLSTGAFPLKIGVTQSSLICKLKGDETIVAGLDDRDASGGFSDVERFDGTISFRFAASPDAEEVYHIEDGGQILVYDLDAGENTKLLENGDIVKQDVNFRSVHRVDGRLVGVQDDDVLQGTLVSVDLDAATSTTYDLVEEGFPRTGLRNQETGTFDGSPVTAINGAFYVHDVENGDYEVVRINGEVKRMVEGPDSLYLAQYNGAGFFEYDGEELVHHGDAEGQSRPLDLIYNEPTNSVIMGTQADYGAKTGGAIATLDLETDEIATHRNVVEDQNVKSLTTVGTTLYAGGTIARAQGTKPATDEAKLLTFDLEGAETERVDVPVPGASHVRELIGHGTSVYGITAGPTRLFVYDTEERAVTDRVEIDQHQFHDQAADGNYYGVAGYGNGGIVRFDPEEGVYTRFNDPDVFSDLHESAVVGDSIFYVDRETWRLQEIDGITDF
jgi:sugar lactone lactonase YvrE